MTTITTIVLSLLLLSGLFLIDLPSASALDCTPGYECNFARMMAVDARLNLHLPNRKFLMSVSKAQRRPNYGELRSVPSGPDPIHHQLGSPQRRPRNSP